MTARSNSPADALILQAPPQRPVQLVLDLPHLSSFGLEDFLISRSNSASAALIESWPDWPSTAVAICGPASSGKSHLAQAWRVRAGAAEISAAQLSDDSIGLLETSGALLVEDIDRGIGDERVLFHILNVARERSLSVLVTSKAPPGDLDISLPDLRSRLRALPVAFIEAPDEALLQAVLVKLFADRQLAVDPHVISYMALHLDRSMAAARRAVAAADELALVKQRKVTRAIAAQAMAVSAATCDRSHGP